MPENIMATKHKVSDDITKQLDEQGVSYELLTETELDDIDQKWRDRFIGKRTAPHLNNYRWHIFSHHIDNRLEGDEATKEYKKQHPADVFIFNERLQYGLRCVKSDKLPDIEMEDFFDDLYICHHSMKWTFVMTHESPDFGPYFSS
jgi:hypothetical protein